METVDNEVLQVLSARKSVRVYTDEPVPGRFVRPPAVHCQGTAGAGVFGRLPPLAAGL